MLAIFQSARAIYFPRISDTPAAVSLFGAFAKISVSAKTKSGADAATAFFTPFHVISATVEVNPSELAAVGTETKGIRY